MKRRSRFFLVGALLFCMAACATSHSTSSAPSKNTSAKKKFPDVVFTVTIKGQTRRYGRDELLHSPLAEQITIDNDPTYHKKMVYTAVPASLVFGGAEFEEGTTLLFSCADGFSAPISAEKILNLNPLTASAYIAIEDPAAPWPQIGKGGSQKSAGPFYLIWRSPAGGQIHPEEWPYQLVSFELKPSVAKQFPDIMPDAKLAATSPVRKGFQLFLQNCFSCHTLNGEGAAAMGPDLNIPMNPTEYLKPGIIEKLVRNNQSIHLWPKAQMSKFGPEALSDADIKNIVAYLKHMAGRKK